MAKQTIQQKLADVLKAHREWVDSEGKIGVQLDLSDVDLYDVDLTRSGAYKFRNRSNQTKKGMLR